MDEEYVNKDSTLQPKLKELELDFLNKFDKVIAEQDLQDESLSTGDKVEGGISESGEKVTSSGEKDNKILQEEAEEGIPELINRKHNPDNSNNKLDNDELIAANPDETLPIE
eukprot:6138960-Ditylum_brightwellii.AAC.2